MSKSKKYSGVSACFISLEVLRAELSNIKFYDKSNTVKKSYIMKTLKVAAKSSY